MIKNSQAISVPKSIIESICKNRDYLSELDSLGDGDHGINMSKGMDLAQKLINDEHINDMTGGFQAIKTALMDHIGGSMGPLYGMFFRGFIKATADKEEINGDTVNEMLHKALNNVESITTAKLGDKSLLDTLIPAVKGFDQEWQIHKNLISSLQNMQKEAQKGFESTRNLKANIGRAARLGDKTVGHLDAGAASCNLILQALAESMIGLERGI